MKKCYYCGEPGHTIKICMKKEADQVDSLIHKRIYVGIHEEKPINQGFSEEYLVQGT
jgi:hypothetical protein